MKLSLNHKWTIILGLAFLCALLPARASGQQQQDAPVPAFEVKALDGHAVRSNQLTPAPKWLLIYVEPSCRPCDVLLRVFRQEPPRADLRQKVIVLVGRGTVADARELADRFDWIPADSWYSDETGKASEALHAQGAPIAHGIVLGGIAWKLGGSLPEHQSLESILLTWIDK